MIPGLEGLDLEGLGGAAAGSGGALTIFGILLRALLKTQGRQICTLTAAVKDAREESNKKFDALKVELTKDVGEIKAVMHKEITDLKNAMEKQIAELGQRISAQELELKHQDKTTTKLEMRIAIVEERGANAIQTRQALEDFREKVLTAITQLKGRTDALFEIAKGKRKPWDMEDEQETKSAS